MRTITTALVAVIALALPAVAAAGKKQPADPATTTTWSATVTAYTDSGAVVPADKVSSDVICGTDCGGGAGYYCTHASRYEQNAFGAGVTVSYDWCWNGSSMWDNHGWGEHNNPCCYPAIQWEGWNPDTDIYHGHRSRGEWGSYTLVIVPVRYWTWGVDNCIQVNEQGGYWGC